GRSTPRHRRARRARRLAHARPEGPDRQAGHAGLRRRAHRHPRRLRGRRRRPGARQGGQAREL
ncbi:MAG: hypothetical protein AVDCRST_MAG48-3780, partial [uncultured Friedmanniella sp.]